MPPSLSCCVCHSLKCSLRMKLLVRCLLLSCLAGLAMAQMEVSNCAKQCSKGCKCPCAAVKPNAFYKYTKMTGKGKNKKPLANAKCLFDPSMGNKCGKCINGGKQCGPPMHKWCQNPKSKVVRWPTFFTSWDIYSIFLRVAREYRTTNTPSPP